MILNIIASPEAIIAGSPGSDTLQIGTSRQATINNNLIIASDLLFTREGKDVLIGVDPEQDLPGNNEVDVFLGDANPPGIPAVPVQFTSRDTFVLGDRYQPYYDDAIADTPGKQDFALIGDFNPLEDIIKLHGSASDYSLEAGQVRLNSPNLIPTTELYFNPANSEVEVSEPELIGVIPGIPPNNLDLNADYFQYQNQAPDAPKRALSRSIKQIATQGIDIPFSDTTNSRGLLYTAGYTTGPLGGVDFGDSDAFVTTFNRFGGRNNTIQFGTEAADFAHGIEVDQRGNFYVSGRTRGDLGEENQGATDIFLARYNRQGNQQWIRQFGTPEVDNSFTNPRLSLDHSNHLIVAGYTTGSLFGTNPSPGSADAWITKYDSRGNQSWGVQFGTPEFDELFALDIDSDNNIYSAGWTLGSFEGNTNAGLYDIFLAKTNTSTGEQEWVKQFGTPDYDWVWDMKYDAQGYLYLTGWTLGDLAGENSGSYDAWLGKFDSDGNEIWIKQFGTPGDDQAVSIDIDAEGSIYLAGTTDDLIGSPQHTTNSPGSFDAWAMKFDSNGNEQWTTQIGTGELEAGYAIEVDSDLIYLTGITEGSLGATHVNSFDGWIAQLKASDGGLTQIFGNNDLIVV